MSYRIVIEPQGKRNYKWWIEEDLRKQYLDFETWVPVTYIRSLVEGFSTSEKRAESAGRKGLEWYKARLELDKQATRQAAVNRTKRKYIDA